jgi:hypothetical protein
MSFVVYSKEFNSDSISYIYEYNFRIKFSRNSFRFFPRNVGCFIFILYVYFIICSIRYGTRVRDRQLVMEAVMSSLEIWWVYSRNNSGLYMPVRIHTYKELSKVPYTSMTYSGW